MKVKNGSPCREMGTTLFEGIAAPAVDLDGVKRPMGEGYDMGAWEFVYNGSVLLIL